MLSGLSYSKQYLSLIPVFNSLRRFVCTFASTDLLTMAGVAKHNAKQEGKSNDGIKGRIDLAIRCHAVRVDQVLEALRELVGPIERWRILVRVDHVEEGRYGTTAEPLEKRNVFSFLTLIRS